jgi:NTP pyrophosphatase (non-canonical NTP hydrolase)
VEQLLEALRKFRDERDWSQFHTPKDLAISVSIEAAELLELFQWRHDGHDALGLDKERVADEAADVLLYTLLLFDRLGLDPMVEAKRKIERNARRYPVRRAFGVADSRAKR